MHVGLDADGEILRTNLVHPTEGPADEVALRGRETTDRFAAFVLLGFLEHVPGDSDAAQVRNVFALGGAAVYVRRADGDVLVKLLHDCFGALHEFSGVSQSPRLPQLRVIGLPVEAGVLTRRSAKTAAEDSRLYTVTRREVPRFGSNAVRRPMSGR